MSDTPIKLLIVEADANGRKRLKDFLASDQFRKYEIHETGSVRDGIEAYFTWSPQCLIVGLDLPDGRGLDLLQAIRTRTGAVAVPMVLLCSADEVAIRAQAVAAGAQEVLSTDRASADNLGWIVACAVERAARLELLDRRNGEPKSVTRQLENDLKALGREIEVREKAEAELRASNQRYQSLVVASAQVVWTTDASGLVEDVPDWRVLTGQTTDQVRGRGWLDVLHPDDRARTDETWSACVQSGSKFETEYRVRTRTGEFRTFAVRGIPILDENGTVREWVGTCADVTDARRALEMLRERDEQLRLALTAGKAGTWRWELETKEAFWSEEYCSVFGLEPGSIKASFESWFDAVHPDDREHVKATVAAAIEGKQDLALAYRIV
ncbi:MAG: PAS domain-containing protein, partial [Blastocatellia bacterium]